MYKGRVHENNGACDLTGSVTQVRSSGQYGEPFETIGITLRLHKLYSIRYSKGKSGVILCPNTAMKANLSLLL
jgi:hypothetical protein